MARRRFVGDGYPVQIMGEEIDPWARICAVVDVFDALTAERPYRRRNSIKSSLEMLEKISNSHLEEEMVQCWISMIGKR